MAKHDIYNKDAEVQIWTCLALHVYPNVEIYSCRSTDMFTWNKNSPRALHILLGFFYPSACSMV